MQPIGTVRASSFPDFLDCALRWAYRNLDGIRSPSRGATQLGTALHASTAAFDQSRIDGSGLTVSDTTDVLIDALHRPTEDVIWGDKGPRSYERQAIELHNIYCTSIAPERNYTHVELKCDALDVITDQGIVRLTGTTDRVREYGPDRFGVSDIKSSGAAVDESGEVKAGGHRTQTGVYTLIAEHEIGHRLIEPAEIIGFQTTGAARIAAKSIGNPADVLIGTDEQPGLIEGVASMLKTGYFPPNPRSMLCSKDWCPAWHLCPYHD